METSKSEETAQTVGHDCSAGSLSDDDERAASTETSDVPRRRWLQVLAGHLVLVNTIGYSNSYGIFEQYYVSELHLSVSQVSWAGGLQIFLLCFVSIFSGRVFDYGLLRPLLVSGSVLMVVGLATASVATKYYQLLLAQGICGGIGAGLVYNPILMCVATYFPKRRVLALTLVTIGASTGGIVFPVIAQQMLPKVGLAWTLRCMALVILVDSIIVVALARDKLPPRPRAPFLELSAFRELPYTLFSIGVFFCSWALYVVYDYITHYAVTVLGADRSRSLVILLILNACGYPGRILSALIADAYLGPLRTLVLLSLALGVLFIGWIGVKTRTSLFVLSALFGFVNGAAQGMIVAGLPSLTTDLNRLGTRSGMVLAVLSVAVLTGPPIAGALIEAGQGRYLYMQIWGGCSMVVGASFVMAAYCVRTRLKGHPVP
ncbi:MFS monocarboxylate transporter [Coniochaeta ligniaria NRRL 30616]|uniref:MFS monocarboxylate transporter n=1 Tax=Coniochaeta ligniaria NRRL 30616 TaxID=1408157 RepID=A0A1J7JU40_9PEZI|nr:MFS monocarboxylate transporter [Coniochaeta ligniaria NRRL 30616]